MGTTLFEEDRGLLLIHPLKFAPIALFHRVVCFPTQIPQLGVPPLSLNAIEIFICQKTLGPISTVRQNVNCLSTVSAHFPALWRGFLVYSAVWTSRANQLDLPNCSMSLGRHLSG